MAVRGFCCGARREKSRGAVAKPRPAFQEPAAAAAAAAAPSAPSAARGARRAAGGPGAQGDAAAAPQPKQLLRAAKDDDVARVTELLDLGLDMEHKGMWGNTPLLCACAYGCAGVADALVKRGADCTVVNDDGATPLLLACMEGLDAAALGMLGRDGVALWPPAATVYNQVVDSSEAQTPLRVACQNGRADLVRALLDQGVLSAAPDAAAVASALVAAAKHGREEVVEILLEVGVEPDAVDEAGATAAQVGTVEVKDLIAARAKPSSRKPAAGPQPDPPEPPAGLTEESENGHEAARAACPDSARGPEPVMTMQAANTLPPLVPQPPTMSKPKPPHVLPPLTGPAGGLPPPVLA